MGVAVRFTERDIGTVPWHYSEMLRDSLTEVYICNIVFA